MRLPRRLGALVASVALATGAGLAAAAPAQALSPVAYAVLAPDTLWVGDTVTLGLDCPTTCPDGVTSATVAISGGPTLVLPVSPDYEVDWVVQGITAGTDASPVTHTLTVSFTDETGTPRTLLKTVRVNLDSPQYVTSLVGNDGLDADVTWQPPLVDGGSPVTGYKVQVDSTGSWISLAASARSFSLAGYPYGPHEVRVIAVNAIGWGWGDNVTVLRGVMPSAPSVSVTGTTTPSLTWTASTAGGTEVTGYTVYAGGTPVLSVPASTLSATLASLDPGPQELAVAADCVWGAGTMSAPVDWVQPSVPSPVPAPSATAGDRSLLVSWDAPSSDGGLPVLEYAVRAFDPFTGTVLGTASSTTTSATVTGLLNGTAYGVSVAARNEMGWSGWTTSGDSFAPVGAAPASATVSLTASTTAPTTSTKVTLSGVLAIAGKSETGQQLQVWGRIAPSTDWVKLGTASASSTGAWSLSRSFTRITAVQVRYLGSGPLNAKPATSAAVTISPTLVVSARTTTTTGKGTTSFRLGATIAVPVASSAAPAGASVLLQKKSGSSWVTVRTGSILSGKAKLLWKPTKRATYSLRVVVSGMGVVRSGISRTLTATVS